ncbi:MAG TPA: hypothetical protein VGI82_12065, partial [Chitinophagaceae bacterium]
MNQYLKTIQDLLRQKNQLSDQDKEALLKAITDADKEWSKVGPTEKGKKATAKLLEETIEELENKRKTIEAQSRELEIETALEKVRTIALSMKEPADMLEVCRVITIELDKLGVKEIRNVQTAIFYEDKGTYMNYEYYFKHDKTIVTDVSYTDHEIHREFAEQMLKGKGGFYATVISKAELPGWIDYQKSTNVFIDRYLETAPSLTYYWHSLGPVALGISIYHPLTEENADLFKRFLKVFELAYRRYTDIEKAESQAKEAKIEAALERVRAASMAMHHSDQLHAVADVLFQQLRAFGGNIMNAGITLCKLDADEDEFWLSSDDGLRPVISIPHTEDWIQKKLYEDWKNKSEFFSIAKGGDELKAHYQYMNSVPSLKPFFKESTDWSFPTWQKWHAAYFSHGYVFMITLEPYDEEKILIRFAKVFQQAYTRFLDLQKAEAQVREAQIEAALEKVRARTMAMQHSDELRKVVSTIYEQLQKLDFNAQASNIVIADKISGDREFWVAGYTQKIFPESYKVPYIRHPYVDAQLDAWKRGEKYAVFEYAGKMKEEFDAIFFTQTDFKNVPAEARKMMIDVPSIKFSTAFFNYGFIQALRKDELTKENAEILQRFAQVFEQTYTRFLDLQKAEAQTRESQIQLALERVRARTMAMHNSGELSETASVLFEQLKQLGAEIWTCGFAICSREDDLVEKWMSSAVSGKLLPPFYIPRDNPEERIMYDAWKQGTDVYSFIEEGEVLKKHFEHFLKSVPEAREIFQSTIESGIPLPAWQQNHVASYNQGYLLFITTKPFVETSIFPRFAKVFEQTYTRFNDLKNAEAQAREAHIETALERVRSRSMGMQKSEELKEVIKIVYDQFVHLNINVDHAGFVVDYKPKGDWNFWIADKNEIPSKITHPYFESVWANQFDKAKEEDSGFFETNLNFEEKNKFYNELLPYIPGLPEESKNFYLSCPGLGASTVLSDNVSLYIENFSGIPYTDEENKILMRFGKVFQQTYTRFLDLQKAEAQTREAQIETALEKVRSRSLAMHKSDELKEVVKSVFDRLHELNIELTATSILIFEKGSRDIEWWLVNNIDQQLSKIKVKYIDILYFRNLIEAKESSKELFSKSYSLQEKNEFFNYAFEHTDFKNAPAAVKKIMLESPAYNMSVALGSNTGILISRLSDDLFSEKDNEILKRFTKVFEQAFTRFLDLQKAEAQTRESQIQLALERVRARTMAMQKSDELSETVFVLFQQFGELGETPDQATIGIVNEKEHVIEYWVTMYGNQLNKVFKFSVDEPHVTNKIYEAWKKGEKSLVINLSGQSLSEFMAYRAGKGGAAVNLDEKRRIINVAFFSKGLLNVQSSESRSEESIHLLERFAAVFEQTYTRFLDLRKAEAQTREAQIEAALERVRGKAMAMHNSEDLSVTASLVFTELRRLGINPIRCGVGLLNKESRKGQLYSATSSANDDSLSLVGWVMLSGHPVMEKIYESWQDQEEYYPELTGEQLRSYYRNLLSGLSIPVGHFNDDDKQYGHFIPFASGCLYAWSIVPYTDVEIKILKRFASVIDLTFRRYIDLKKSETNARETVKQAALDRIRADIASMRTITDLERITPLIWNELTILGVPFIRCGVFIMDESQQLIHTFLSTPDGKAIAAFHIPFETPGNIGLVVDHWYLKKDYIDHWDESAFSEFAATLVKQGALDSPEHYLKNLPSGGFYLHFLPFLQGMLYVGNTDRLSDYELKLTQSIADAFSAAYARYEDFNKLELAKKQVDSTLNELQVTQKQLIQAEKMASLGELTAGIAHEIQNPLNFVNNF